MVFGAQFIPEDNQIAKVIAAHESAEIIVRSRNWKIALFDGLRDESTTTLDERIILLKSTLTIIKKERNEQYESILKEICDGFAGYGDTPFHLELRIIAFKRLLALSDNYQERFGQPCYRINLDYRIDAGFESDCIIGNMIFDKNILSIADNRVEMFRYLCGKYSQGKFIHIVPWRAEEVYEG